MSKKTLFRIFYIAIVAFRILSLPLFLWFPIKAWILVFFADYVDYGLALRAGYTYKTYQYIDKSVDAITRIYFVIAAYLLAWQLAPVFLFLFLLRSTGDLIYLVTKSEKYMFYFPNIIEFFFLFYAVYLQLWPGANDSMVLILLFVLATVLKILHEYLLHVQGWIDGVSLRYIKTHPEHKRNLHERYK